jgi:hypothetical protein
VYRRLPRANLYVSAYALRFNNLVRVLISFLLDTFMATFAVSGGLCLYSMYQLVLVSDVHSRYSLPYLRCNTGRAREGVIAGIPTTPASFLTLPINSLQRPVSESTRAMQYPETTRRSAKTLLCTRNHRRQQVETTVIAMHTEK